MQYKIIVFHGGDVHDRSKVEAASALSAAKKASKPSRWTHITVVGKKIHRFVGPKYISATDTPSLYKVLWRGEVPSILAMFGTVSEFYKFNDAEQRDKSYEEMSKCITSMSAGSAKAKAALTSIIVSLGEISGTKSISTSRKTLSGSAMSAIWPGTPTRESTDRRSGTRRSDDTAMNTWSSGSKVYPSKRNQIFYATVRVDGKDASEYPGITYTMQRMNGKTYQFEYNHKKGNISYYKGNHYLWSAKWIDPKRIHATVKVLDNPSPIVSTLGATTAYNSRYAGKKLVLKKCPCGCNSYKFRNAFFDKSWLDISDQKGEFLHE